MDTKPLESFAKAARRELIAAVSAQASAVLVPGSVARTERAETVRRLETEIAAHGHERVIDKVAYTWFNRLIALRFMDAKGYTAAGVVSPAHGQAHGQPEILADAKRGDIDADVVTNAVTRGAILGLLDGTRRSTDAEGEAYALLLTEYCRYWHKAMPFMFEREGDYTELLVPAGLLADGGIVARARNVLSEEVCDDVEVIGWVYQFYISERKQQIFNSKAKRGAAEIPAATQLFTPHWIVRYLVENSVGRLWMLNRPTSQLIDRMDYYIAPADEEADFLKVSGPEELTVIDPACGSGHMLTYAFDLLYAIYDEAGYAPSEIPSLILTHNLHGTEIDPRAGALAAFALTMKARAQDRRFLSREVEPKICVIEPIVFAPDELDFLVRQSGDRRAEELFWNQFRDADVLGSLIQPDSAQTAQAAAVLPNLEGGLFHGETLERARQAVRQAGALARRYSVVTANPPYMGSNHMDARLTAFAKAAFKESKSDLFAMFIQRCLALTLKHGATAMITMQSWMFISSYEALRHQIVRASPPVSMVHLGERAFDSIGGSVVSTTAFVLEPGRKTASETPFIRVVDGKDEEAKQLDLSDAVRNVFGERRFSASADDFAKIPGSPIAYWLSDALRAVFKRGHSLKDVTSPRQGMATADNARFVRLWWEVSQSRSRYNLEGPEEACDSRAKWFPYTDGGDFRRWYGNRWAVVNWEGNGNELRGFDRAVIRNPEYYFKPSVTWSAVGTGVPAFRSTPAGSLFSNAGMSMFASPEGLDFASAVCNSTTAERLFAGIAPTLNLGVGEIGRLPMVPLPGDVVPIVQSLVDRSRVDWDDFESSWDFAAPSWLSDEDGPPGHGGSLRRRYEDWSATQVLAARAQQANEVENNRLVAEAYGLTSEVSAGVPLHRVSLTRNVEFRYGPDRSTAEYEALERADFIADLISYAIGCVFGRYSLDKSGLVLADQGSTLQDYLAKIPSPSFRPDADNVIPFVDDGWFEDDVVERFRQFLRTAFGAEHFDENLRFVEESLGVKTLRDYFMTKSGKSKFYDDHVQRYKKRPIYWMFSSSKGSFNALIYLHRYAPSTVSTVLNEYLREYEAKLTVALQQAESSAVAGGSAKDQKEADRLRKVLAELRDYEHDVLFPLATQQIAIDLDDGVKANYPKFYPAARRITGLEASDG